MNNLDSHIEAILFLKGEPMSARELAKILGAEESPIKEAIGSLEEKLAGRGIRLVSKDDSVMLATSPESSQFTRTLVEGEFDAQFTKAALETLSIVVYRGPATRSDIDHIRGVNSSFILRNLLVRGLVERITNPRDSRSYLYKPSFQLLQYLGIKNIKEMPEYGDVNEKIKEFTQENAKQENIGDNSGI